MYAAPSVPYRTELATVTRHAALPWSLEPQGTRTGIGSLLLGVYDGQGALRYAGNVGTGFNERTLRDLKRKLDALAASISPFSSPLAAKGKPHWAKPKLVAEVSFGEWTRSHHIRHAVFRGLRSDKDPKRVVREKAAGAPVAKPGKGLRVTHAERVIDASTGITKIELVRYYGLVVDLMMAHLRGRPVSLLRAPNGVGGAVECRRVPYAQCRIEIVPASRAHGV